MVSQKRNEKDEQVRLQQLQGAARRLHRRTKANAVFEKVARYLPISLVVGLLLVVLKRQGFSLPVQDAAIWGLSSVPLLIALFRVVLRPAALSRSALALDRYHGLAGRITNALVFSQLPVSRQSVWMKLAIRDGLAASDQLQPNLAAPLRLPKQWGWSLALAAGLFAIPLWPPAPLFVPPLVTLEPPSELLGNDDLALLREAAESLAETATSSENIEALKQYRSLIEKAAERSISREQLFRQLQVLEKSLADNQLRQSALKEGLEAIARALSKSALAKRIANSLKPESLADAGLAMRQLAEKLGNNSLTGKSQRKQLSAALKSASEQTQGRTQRLEAARRQLTQKRRRLLKKKGSGKPRSSSEKKQLARQERRLKRLNRQIKRAKQAQRALSKLDRELAAAAESLLREMGQSAQELQQGAQEVEQLAAQQMSDRQKRDLKKQLERMRELVRKAGQGGKQQRRRMEKFARRARGKEGQAQKQGRAGQPASGRRMGILPVPVPQVGLSSASAQSEGTTSQGNGPNGGRGEDTKAVPPSEPELRGRTQDVTAVALDTGSGLASTEVVYAAAERGFASGEYRKVFTDYQTVAEEVLEKQGIPTGYEQSVRRYFQLIRPRAAE